MNHCVPAFYGDDELVYRLIRHLLLRHTPGLYIVLLFNPNQMYKYTSQTEGEDYLTAVNGGKGLLIGKET